MITTAIAATSFRRFLTQRGNFSSLAGGVKLLVQQQQKPANFKRFLASHGGGSDLSSGDKAPWERSDAQRIYYGINLDDAETDEAQYHFDSMFIALFCIAIPVFYIYFYPDMKEMDWAHREAHLQLERREKLGLPLVDPDYVPRDKIKLPSEEELGDTKVIF